MNHPRDDRTDGKKDQARDLNRDPITKTPGAHPVGVGVGGAAGGMAAGAAAGTVLGPVGTLIGAAAGVVAGAAIGKRVAERIDPTGEAEYWREAHRDRPYVKQGDYDYERDYAPAYGFGLQAREADRGRSWDDSEASLQREWQASRQDSTLGWDEARPAVRDAWERAERTHDLYARSDAYHADAFERAPYRQSGDSFDDFRPAYRYGAYARAQHADRDWDDALAEALGSDWTSRRGASALDWERAKPAVREAYVSNERYTAGQYSGVGGEDGDRFRVG